jgi:phenylalanyl-tRNA synthetase alpha chain
MVTDNLVSKLHPLERKVLPILQRENELSHIAQASQLTDVEVLRALQWLENKGMLTINTEKKKIVSLDVNGRRYRKDGLPEKAFLQSLSDEYQDIHKVAKDAGLTSEELHACIGLLKRKGAIAMRKENTLQVKITSQGKQLLNEHTPEELFLAKSFPITIAEFTGRDRAAFENLKKRKGILNVEEKKIVTVALTDRGKKLAAMKLSDNVINRLTPNLLKTGQWRKKTFRAYDVEINVPRKYGGKKHFVEEAVEYIRRIWLEMGFREMTGNYVQSAFWDLDALFVPQDHPAREMQDTFYLSGSAKLPSLWKTVKNVHENGGNTGSTGWQYSFSKAEAEQLLLRTHTTVLSARTIATLKKADLPAKFFAVGKVFRNEALDWKHLFEFYQVEGIVVDPDANLKHLKGYLRQFYRKMGFPKVRMRPAHFPYTEPSLEVDVFHPIKKEWVELGGAGIFRPEVVKPLLGFDCPVLAWGQGMGRIIADYWNITDIRDLYKNDIQQLREMNVWVK